jgi:hypothetical protein
MFYADNFSGFKMANPSDAENLNVEYELMQTSNMSQVDMQAHSVTSALEIGTHNTGLTYQCYNNNNLRKEEIKPAGNVNTADQ